MENQSAPLHPSLIKIRDHAESLGYTIHGMLMEARVPPQYWARWIKHGFVPTEETVKKILAVDKPAPRKTYAG